MLDTIIEHKRRDVAARRALTSLESLRARATPTHRSLSAALRRSRPGFILEIKSASPSAGTIRRDSCLDPVIESYGRHADAVSVLTDERFFGGSLARLADIRRRLSQPILCKDFILDPFQVVEARLHGADAILLILAAINDDTWRSCALEAARLGMEVITEVHDEAETARALALGAPIVGINNRNLRTLDVDLGTTARLSRKIPSDRLIVAESGIAGRESVLALRPHADAFLIGSALMRESDIDRAVRRIVYGRTKICGLTAPRDAELAAAGGATHGGLIFTAASPRMISEAAAARIASAAALEWVGVFADQPASDIARIAARLDLAAVQLHGGEREEEIARVRATVPAATAVWKAERVRTSLPTKVTDADRLVLDGFTEGRLGGTGVSFDWSLLENYANREEVILAGGLRPDNVARAAAVGTWALDVCSGIESSPGRKSEDLLASFLAERRRIPGRGEYAA